MVNSIIKEAGQKVILAPASFHNNKRISQYYARHIQHFKAGVATIVKSEAPATKSSVNGGMQHADLQRIMHFNPPSKG